MRDALVTAAVFVFAAIMLLFPAAWEPLPEAEAKRLFGEDG